jgi:hypothetical protein
MPSNDNQTMRQLALVQLNSLLYTGALPAAVFDGSQIRKPGTPIYDLNGELLFYRVPVTKGKGSIGFADVAATPALGASLLRLTRGIEWDEQAIREEAIAQARKQTKELSYDQIRFVAYSPPKVAIQFLQGDREVLMLEWLTWAVVPEKRERERDEPPSNFERWSLLDEMPARTRKANVTRFEEQVREWERLVASRNLSLTSTSYRLDARYFADIDVALVVNDMRELHYSTNLSDHHPCYEVRGQQTNVWCVAASVQMLLDFYRYNYLQTRLASELGLGTLANPNGLPYSRDGDVVKVLQKMTSNALSAAMNTSPNWTQFRNEIRANRPLISFVPGHSRTVAGYTRSGFVALLFRGLLVYDPWPPNAGVITQWENFDATTYRRTFTAQVTLV